MASAKDDVFLKVEAVLSLDWVKRSGKDLTTMLEEIENLGIESISFSRGNHILVGSLEQLVRIREHFLGRERQFSPGKRAAAYSEKRGDDYAERCTELQRNDLSKKRPLPLDQKMEASNALDADWVVEPKKDRPNSGKEPAEPKDQQISKELMVDNDIWGYIENKRADELKDLETMFAATMTKAEDDSGVLKISITPKSNDTTSEEVVIMHETLVGLYQETFMRCVIEKHEVHFSDEEGELILEYISEKFPDVFAKRCIYNDDFLFIGPPRMAREAREQFQVLAQRLKRGQLKAKMDNRAVFDNYERTRRRRDSYEDRYNFHEDDLYKEPPYEYTNNFQNVSNEDMVKEENRRDSFAEDEGRVVFPGGDTNEEDEGRVVSPGGDTNEELNNELSNEEEEEKVEEQKPPLNLNKDLDLPVVDSNRPDKNNHLKFSDEVKQYGSSSLVYYRQDDDEVGVPKRSSSDVEDDDWKKEFPTKNLGNKKDKKVDESAHDLPERKFEKSFKTRAIPDFVQNATKTSWSASSLYDDDRSKNDEPEIESAKAAKSLEDVSDRKKGQTQDDGQILNNDPPTARIDANSITYRSVDPGFGQSRDAVASKSFEEFITNSADEKTGSTERLEKKPQKTRKKGSESGPKVKIIKQTVPMFTEPGGDAQKEVASELKVFSEPKVISEKSGSDAGACAVTTSRAVKSSYRDILGPPCRVVGDLEKHELTEVFKAQRRSLKKMRFDSESSEDDDDAEIHGRKQDKCERHTQEVIEELMLRGDEESQKLLQSLLENATKDAGGKKAPVDNGKVENAVADEATPGGGKLKVDVPVPAAEKPPASGRRAKAKNQPTVPQPPDGDIGCVIDKAFHLEGHNKSGTIEINISFEAGNQADDQLEPGRPYQGLTMKAFLPASGDGRETLRLMKAAFTARKLFTLEEKDDGSEDVIVPNGVTFKDNIELYPDPGYLPKVIEQLRFLTEQAG